jgi:HTH-type transcriptional regulator/antitoxin HigA
MIQNKRQHNVTKKQIETLSESLKAAGQETDIDPRLYAAMVAGIRSQIDDLQQEVREFEELQNASLLHMKCAEEFARVLIQGRVARGLTQNELANKLNLKPQQIQKYEATQYQGASLKRILAILGALDLDFEADIPLRK